MQWLFVSMSLAILGSIFLQYKWIKESMQVKEEAFNSMVSDALQRAADAIERTETSQMAANFLLQRIGNAADPDLVRLLMESSHYVAQKQSNIAAICKQPAPPPTPTNIAIIDKNNEEAQAYLGISFENHQEEEGAVVVSDVVRGSPADEAGLSPEDIIIAVDDDTITNAQMLMKHLKEHSAGDELHISYQRRTHTESQNLLTVATLQGKTQAELIATTEFMQVQMSNDLGEKESITKSTVDTIIRNTLKEAGINQPYQYAVKSGKKMVLHYPDVVSPELKTTNFRKKIYRNSMRRYAVGEIFLYFPKYDRYLWSDSKSMFALSLFLNLTLIMTFAYSVYAILHQKKLSDMKTDFINNMTHELKTPISTIRLATEMLTDKSLQHQPQNIQRYAGIIKEENQRLEGHVEKVLQFARLERGSINLRNENIDLVELLDNILQKTMLQVQTVEGELHYEPADEDLTIWGDKEHIQNMIYNLLDNAIKYSKQCPIITVKTNKTPDGYVSIAISDEGIGMSKDELQKVFDKFYRVTTGKLHDVKGFGLGLSYVKLMVDAHKGKINVSSKLGKGSTFELLFRQKPEEIVA